MTFLILLKIILTRAINSIQWCLDTPPIPHTFLCSPVQFNISIYTEIVADIVEYINQCLPDNIHIEHDRGIDWDNHDFDFVDHTAFDHDINDCCDHTAFDHGNSDLIDFDKSKSMSSSSLWKTLSDLLPSAKQDFGKLWPNSSYAQQYHDLVAQNSTHDVIVMMANDNDPRQTALDFAREHDESFRGIYNSLHDTIAVHNTARNFLVNWFDRQQHRISVTNRTAQTEQDAVDAFWDNVIYWAPNVNTREEFMTYLHGWVTTYLTGLNGVNSIMDILEDAYPEHAWYVQQLNWRGTNISEDFILMFYDAGALYSIIPEMTELIARLDPLISHEYSLKKD